MTEHSHLRLSAVRAFLGRIVPQIRIVKISLVSDVIVLFCGTSGVPTDLTVELVSDAAGEIIADYPQLRIEERVEEVRGMIPIENMIEEGWIYQRYEES